MRLIFLFQILISYINALTYTAKKLQIPKFRGLSSVHSQFLPSKGLNGLYTIPVCLGDNNQCFDLVFDTASRFLWVGDKNCLTCPSSNLYDPSLSTHFKNTSKPIDVFYGSGKIHGFLCQDSLLTNQTILISNFNFVLTDDSTISRKVDGIAGFFKKYKDDELQYSFINQLVSNEKIQKKLFSVDLTKKTKKIYFGTKENLFGEYSTVSCSKESDDLEYWRCDARNFKIEGKEKSINQSVIYFDTGTNGIVAPVSFWREFKDPLFENVLPLGCEESLDDGVIYQVKCKENVKETILKEKIHIPKIEFVLNGAVISIDIVSLFNEETFEFDIYFYDIGLKGWVLGVPFFEQYPVTFDMEKEEIAVHYGVKSVNMRKILIIFGCFAVAIIICLVFKKLKKERKIIEADAILNYSEVEDNKIQIEFGYEYEPEKEKTNL